MYLTIIGNLVYLTINRPDIAYVVHIVSQFVVSPTTVHCALGSCSSHSEIASWYSVRVFSFFHHLPWSCMLILMLIFLTCMLIFLD